MAWQSVRTEDGITTIQLGSRLLRVFGIVFALFGAIGMVGLIQQGRFAAPWIAPVVVTLFLVVGLVLVFDVDKLRVHSTHRTIERVEGTWPFLGRRTVVFTDGSLIVAEPFANLSKYGPAVLYRVIARGVNEGREVTLMDGASQDVAVKVATECGNRMACKIQVAESHA